MLETLAPVFVGLMFVGAISALASVLVRALSWPPPGPKLQRLPLDNPKAPAWFFADCPICMESAILEGGHVRMKRGYREEFGGACETCGAQLLIIAQNPNKARSWTAPPPA